MRVFGFFIGLLFVGVLVGLPAFVGMSWGGVGKFCMSREVVDSLELRFFGRVGAILYGFNTVCSEELRYRLPEIENSAENIKCANTCKEQVVQLLLKFLATDDVDAWM
jgi:hypothetical protein